MKQCWGAGLSRQRLFGSLALLLASCVCAARDGAAELDRIIQNAFAGNSVTALIMTDEDVVNLGLLDFDPNDYVNASDQLGSEDSTARRSNLKSITIPLRRDVYSDDNSSFYVGGKLAYLQNDQDLSFAGQSGSQEDALTEKTALLGVGAGYTTWLNERWELEAGLYLNWLHYSNDVRFNSDASRALAPLLEGYLTDISYNVLIAEPVVTAKYHIDLQQTHLELFARYHYLNGSTVDPDKKAHDFSPEAWYASMGVLAKRPFTGAGWQRHSLWYRVAQVNMGGDLHGALGTDKYYEAGVAWLVETPGLLGGLLDSVGLGVNLNYGSDLKGGTLIFLFNK